MIAAVAKEPRLGRWMRIKEGKEGAIVAVIRLLDAPPPKDESEVVNGNGKWDRR